MRNILKYWTNKQNYGIIMPTCKEGSKKFMAKIKQRALILILALSMLGTMGLWGCSSPIEYHEKDFDTLEEIRDFLPSFYFFEFEFEGIEWSTFRALSNCIASPGFTLSCFSRQSEVPFEEVNWTGYWIEYARPSTEGGSMSNFRVYATTREHIRNDITNKTIEGITGYLSIGTNSGTFWFYIGNVYYGVDMLPGFARGQNFEEYFLSTITLAIANKA